MGAQQPVELPSHEVLSQLAREDPQAYEALRLALIQGFIDSVPAGMKPRLRGIQFRVDCVRQLSRSALGSTVRVYKLMWESFLRLNESWHEAVQLPPSHAEPHTARPGGARILEFRPRPPHERE